MALDNRFQANGSPSNNVIIGGGVAGILNKAYPPF